MAEDEVKSIGKKLAKYNSDEQELDEGTILDLLKKLQESPITLDILHVTTLSKTLIKQWKKLLAGGDSKSGKVSLPRNESISSNMSDSQQPFEASSSQESSQNGSSKSKDKDSNRQTVFPSVKSTDDDVRDKCRDMIHQALVSGELPDHTGDPEAIAARVEDALLDLYRGPNDKYKGAVRKRVFNLRDKKNTDLRLNVLTGTISAVKFAKMTSEEMASDDIRNLREKFTKEAINDHQMAVQQGTPSDMFKCGKCQKKNCTYTQVQTRSADEPMTTFVYCRECGNRWKFC